MAVTKNFVLRGACDNAVDAGQAAPAGRAAAKARNVGGKSAPSDYAV